MAVFHCAVCRQTTFAGKKHIYSKSHQAKLKVVLVKFLEKVKEARRALRAPRVEKLDATEHRRTFWCYCCGLEVQRHVTDGKLAVLCAGLLEHMATLDHKKNTNKFWWDNKADPKLKGKFLVTAEEIERFKSAVSKALDAFEEEEDTLLKEQADIIRAQEQHRQEVLQSLLEPEPETASSGSGQQEAPEAGPSVTLGPASGSSSCLRALGSMEEAEPCWMDPLEQSHWPEPETSLTFIGYQDSSIYGNIHTGAIPPWLLDDPQEGSSSGTVQEIGPSHQEFLKHKEKEKLKKLPANRVGANFDHTSQTDANWFPSFGRVWNSGRRWQSRNQFREEEGQAGRKAKKRRVWSKLGQKPQKPPQ
ncbi:centrosomal AT-AC splicing factor isoform X1 [Paramormyrops kingsleyae]|uniref:centrosomal AT-AC splicing factor isoform X1 n=1 Tax=Paramormyrops kingsleyae TaxID=1676925 RepID=UPI003B976999